MESSIEEIKKKLDIVEFIGSFVTLKKAGRNFKAPCPFHQEKTPSFVVSPDRQIWHCFGSCGEGGDIIRFLMKLENLTFSEALGDLAKRAGVELRTANFDDKAFNKKQRLIELNVLASEFYEYLLHNSPFGEKAREYLKERGINAGIIKKFHLGYAPSSWGSLMTFMKKKKFRDDELLRAGLAIRSDKGSYYDRFRGRLIFPLRDTRGVIVGFSGRLLEGDVHEAKYINTPETELYHKRETLFGIDIAKDAIKREGNVLVVEGEFDVITPFQYGIEHVVAIKGSAVTREQLMLLKRYTPKITLALDGDDAGMEAVKRGIIEAEEMDLDLGVAQFESGKDPDEAVRNDAAGFKKAIQSPLPLYDFIFQAAQKKYPDSDPYSKKKIGDEVVPYLIKIRNPIVQSHYIKKVANFLEVSEESVIEAARRNRTIRSLRPSYAAKTVQAKAADRFETLQKYVLSLLFQSEEPYVTADQIFTVLSPTDFTIPVLEKIVVEFLQFKSTHDQFHPTEFAETLPQPLRIVFDEVYLIASSEVHLAEGSIDKLSLELKKHALKRQIAEFLAVSSEKSGAQEGELLQITQRLKEVEKRIATV
jgi:DNA primase